MNIFAMKVLTPVCVVSRCVADSSVSDYEHLCEEHSDTCVSYFQVSC